MTFEIPTKTTLSVQMLKKTSAKIVVAATVHRHFQLATIIKTNRSISLLLTFQDLQLLIKQKEMKLTLNDVKTKQTNEMINEKV